MKDKEQAAEQSGKGKEDQHPEEHKKKKKKEELAEEYQQKLEEKEEEVKRLKDSILYLQADMDNLKKIKAREVQDAHQYGNEKLVRELLPVIDNLERAIDHAENSEDFKSIHEGVQLTLAEFVKALEKSGVSRIEASGKVFDPNFHEAYYQEERDDVDPDTVVAEFQKGYVLNGRLIRPSVVSIAKKPESKE